MRLSSASATRTPRIAYHHKMAVLSLVERGTGKARSIVLDKLGMDYIMPIVRANVHYESRIMTDEAPHYRYVKIDFADHGQVRHRSGEYGRGDIHTNTIEGFFSIFKRGMRGVYQWCAEKH